MTSKIQQRLVSQLEAKGKPASAAYAISTKALQRSGNLKAGSTKPTAQGVARGNMTPAARAKSRAVKANGGQASDYTYSARTNRATRNTRSK